MWVILDGGKEIATGFSEIEQAFAEERLEQYCDPRQYWRFHRKKRATRQGTIYFIEAIGLDYVKVGFTTDLEKRMADLRTALPVRLMLLGSITGPATLEGELHTALAAHRHTGEWFAKAPAIEAMRSYGVDVVWADLWADKSVNS